MNIPDTQLIDCEQGSEEWHKARAGVISASMFSTIRKKVGGLNEKQQAYVEAIQGGATEQEALQASGFQRAPQAKAVQDALAGKPVGELSREAKMYAFRLAIERINEGPLTDEQFETYAMRRGRELEEDCRKRHESDIEVITDLAGFVRTTDTKFGCSADSLVDEEGGGEYKCFVAPDKLYSIVVEDDWGDVMDQTQGCLWLTGRKWWDMCLYCPPLANAGKDFLRKRVERDDNYIEALEADLWEFDQLVESYRGMLMKDMNRAPNETQPEEEPELEVAW